MYSGVWSNSVTNVPHNATDFDDFIENPVRTVRLGRRLSEGKVAVPRKSAIFSRFKQAEIDRRNSYDDDEFGWIQNNEVVVPVIRVIDTDPTPECQQVSCCSDSNCMKECCWGGAWEEMDEETEEMDFEKCLLPETPTKDYLTVDRYTQDDDMFEVFHEEVFHEEPEEVIEDPLELFNNIVRHTCTPLALPEGIDPPVCSCNCTCQLAQYRASSECDGEEVTEVIWICQAGNCMDWHMFSVSPSF